MLVSGMTGLEPMQSAPGLPLNYSPIQPLCRGRHRLQEEIKNKNVKLCPREPEGLQSTGLGKTGVPGLGLHLHRGWGGKVEGIPGKESELPRAWKQGRAGRLPAGQPRPGTGSQHTAWTVQPGPRVPHHRRRCQGPLPPLPHPHTCKVPIS